MGTTFHRPAPLGIAQSACEESRQYIITSGDHPAPLSFSAATVRNWLCNHRERQDISSVQPIMSFDSSSRHSELVTKLLTLETNAFGLHRETEYIRHANLNRTAARLRFPENSAVVTQIYPRAYYYRHYLLPNRFLGMSREEVKNQSSTSLRADFRSVGHT
jgi:hypothetical protein